MAVIGRWGAAALGPSNHDAGQRHRRRAPPPSGIPPRETWKRRKTQRKNTKKERVLLVRESNTGTDTPV